MQVQVYPKVRACSAASSRAPCGFKGGSFVTREIPSEAHRSTSACSGALPEATRIKGTSFSTATATLRCTWIVIQSHLLCFSHDETQEVAGDRSGKFAFSISRTRTVAPVFSMTSRIFINVTSVFFRGGALGQFRGEILDLAAQIGYPLTELENAVGYFSYCPGRYPPQAPCTTGGRTLRSLWEAPRRWRPSRAASPSPP